MVAGQWLRARFHVTPNPQRAIAASPQSRVDGQVARVTGKRIDAIDFARGVAIALMILSHGVKGLLSFEQIPAWGMVPVHLVTKFSSSLFVLVFGIALAVGFLPHAGTERWPARRRKLWVRGLVVLFWYKVLTIVEMVHLYSPEDIVTTLMHRAFPVYVEILAFYGIALLWIPWVLPWWKKAPLLARCATPFAVAVLGQALYWGFHFWDNDVLQAVLVEHERHYTWGQLTRGPLVFVGLLIGELAVRCHVREPTRRRFVGVLGGAAAILFIAFIVASAPALGEQLLAIAHNQGKHPPESHFMLFSLGGAFAILAVAFWGNDWLPAVMKPITLIGQHALQAFVFHIFIIFVFFRFLLGYWQQITYLHALTLSLALIAATAVWVHTLRWVRAHS